MLDGCTDATAERSGGPAPRPAAGCACCPRGRGGRRVPRAGSGWTSPAARLAAAGRPRPDRLDGRRRRASRPTGWARQLGAGGGRRPRRSAADRGRPGRGRGRRRDAPPAARLAARLARAARAPRTSTQRRDGRGDRRRLRVHGGIARLAALKDEALRASAGSRPASPIEPLARGAGQYLRSHPGRPRRATGSRATSRWTAGPPAAAYSAPPTWTPGAGTGAHARRCP